MQLQHDDICHIKNIHGELELWRALWDAGNGSWWFKPLGRHGDKKKFHTSRVVVHEGPRKTKAVL